MKKYTTRSELELVNYKKITKYLKLVDKNKWYSNFGPIYLFTKNKIEKFLNYLGNEIILTASGHSSVLAVCKYLSFKNKDKKKKYVICQSYNFFSAPLAIIESNLHPYFIDIDQKTHTIDLNLLERTIKKLKNKIAFIIFTSPYGNPICLKKLNNLQDNFKIPIVYDAADTFLNLEKNYINNKVFITCSFHPSKTMGANESGLIICQKKHTKFLNQIINFGINKNNLINNSYGFNGKFSEYDAAILLANFENRLKKIKFYKKMRSKIIKKLNLDIFGPLNLISNKITFQMKDTETVENKNLKKYNIILQKWWSNTNMHKIKIFRKYKKTSMSNSNFIKKKIRGFFINKYIKI